MSKIEKNLTSFKLVQYDHFHIATLMALSINRVYGYNTIIEKGGDGMISYDPFWKTLKRTGVTQYCLINEHGVSNGTLDHIRKGHAITTTTINQFCRILHCNVQDIIIYLPDKK